MDFNNFKYEVPNLRKIALPGEPAHYKMAPLSRIQELEDVHLTKEETNTAGVMAIFYPNMSGETNFVLILRKTYRGVHSNQIGFPGGRVEMEDEDLWHTAIRETEEEVGIPREAVKEIRKLTKLYIPPSNFWVQPFMGFMEKTPNLIPQETEVEKILEVDLDDFLNERNITEQILSTSYSDNIKVPAFVLNDHVVWGATAMMLYEVREMLTKVFQK